MVHGGAGTLFDGIVVSKLEGVKTAVQVGYKALINGNAADAVEQAIRCMDDSEHFNSGKGSMLTVKGEVENDAVIMNGDLSIGAVSCCQNIEHPISLSRLIMDRAPCTLLSGSGATEFAIQNGMEILKPGALVTPRAKNLLENFKKFEGMETGIVGAVALDKNGMLCAGTSSGGVNNKPSGRCCCCLAGCQVFANNNVAAVAVTGEGESILKTCLAYLILSNIKNGLSLSEAIQKGLFLMDMRLHTTGGAIALGTHGELGFYFNTKRMPWAYQVGNSIHFGIEKGEHNIEEV
ncbi:l-asparaginase [Holotrichia oblita]|uniref:L-asparaginase n=1 Tax=Holotrichia oblita TaxID=644536 RepID=A0ACB9SMG2_HOLOL|nr:l-asparaginase [Holotrichia oblita]